MMSPFKEGSVCIFAKSPKLGEVKTRLEPDLGREGCLNLHKWLVEDSVKTFSGNQELAYDVELHVTGSLQDKYWVDVCSNYSMPVFLQSGATLGDRMWHAVQKVLQRKKWVVLIGADCPELDTAYVDEAISVLASGKDAVIGPADDGGYVLLGLSLPVKRVFQGIDWGSSKVYEQSLAAMEEVGLSYAQLAALKDLDVMDDYLYYRSKIDI